MNIFDIIDKKKVDEVLKQNGVLEKQEETIQEKSQPKTPEVSNPSQAKIYADKFFGFIQTEKQKFVRSKALKTSLEHMSANEMQRLNLLAIFIKLNPNMTQQEFREMIDDKSFVSFKKLVSEYPYNDFVEEIRDHGSIYIASKINFNRELGKLYDDIEEINFNNDNGAW